MRFALPLALSPSASHRLDPAKIIETAENLARRIGDSLPASSLAGLAAQLRGSHVRPMIAPAARSPNYAIRAASLLAIAATILGLWYLVSHIHTRWEFGTITELFEATDAGFNLLVLLAGALWFLITLETRFKRKKALGFIEELREFIHVIDVTQLYYTPDLYKVDSANSGTSLNIDYTYPLFCTEMLAVISNLAPIYTRGAVGDSILRAVSEVEMLANAVSAKLLSKAESVRGVSARG